MSQFVDSPGDRSDFKALDHNRLVVLFQQAIMGTTPVSTKFEAEPHYGRCLLIKAKPIPLKQLEGSISKSLPISGN
jgi:hypothetical protein